MEAPARTTLPNVGAADRRRHWAQRQRRLEDRTWPQALEGATTRGRSSVPLTDWLIISIALEVMKIFLLFYVCHYAIGLTRCYKTAVFCIYMFIDTLLLSILQRCRRRKRDIKKKTDWENSHRRCLTKMTTTIINMITVKAEVVATMAATWRWLSRWIMLSSSDVTFFVLTSSSPSFANMYWSKRHKRVTRTDKSDAATVELTL